MRHPAAHVDERTGDLSRIGVGAWYLDHVGKIHHGVTCGCQLLEPDEECDLGMALFRLRVREVAARITGRVRI